MSAKKNHVTARPDPDSAVHRSSGNVFVDLGHPDAEERLAKARLAHIICSIIRSAKLTQVQAGKILGIDQPKVSALMRGRLREFSTERLMRFITQLDHDVVITVRSPQRHHRGGLRVLAEA
jgi:predicted XRE-type DNA-binding protein